MSNVKRGNRAVTAFDRPLKVGETIEQQPDGSVLSVIKLHERTVTDPKTGEVKTIPSPDARTTRVDMPTDYENGTKPWYLKHMIVSEQREVVLANEAELKEVEAVARKEFEAKRDAARPVNPIRAQADALEAAKKKTASKKKDSKKGDS